MLSFIGEIKLFAFQRTPEGWLKCEGQLLPITNYQPLYSLIHTTYGGDGSSTFALPDLRGRVPISLGQGSGLSSRQLGETVGTTTVTLTPAQLPAHSHAFIASSGAATTITPGPNVTPATTDATVRQFIDTSLPTAATKAFSPQTIASAGGGAPHQNMMPTTAMQFAICYDGLYPPQ